MADTAKLTKDDFELYSLMFQKFIGELTEQKTVGDYYDEVKKAFVNDYKVAGEQIGDNSVLAIMFMGFSAGVEAGVGLALNADQISKERA